MEGYRQVEHFEYYETLEGRLSNLHNRVQDMRRDGPLKHPQALRRINQFFKIKSIYHSNAIEGNQLTIGETRLVVEMGMTIAGKTLKDRTEAINLSGALDFMEDIASAAEKPITLSDLRQIHTLILKDIRDDYAGQYRLDEAKITGSEFPTTPSHLVPQAMSEFGEFINKITSLESANPQLPIVCAAAAHAWLAQIHPFGDGNGRTARILMNLILMRNGYPPCVIMREDRMRYYHALEDSQSSDLTALIELIYENVEESLEEWEKAVEEQREHQEWLTSLTAKFEQPEMNKARNEYEVWRRAMALLKSYFKQTVDAWNEQFIVGRVHLNFRDYGTLDFHKYLSFRDGGLAKRTWDFGIEFRRGERHARYLFYYGWADFELKPRSPVALIISKNIDFTYVRLQKISQSNVPDIYQVGFDISEQTFVALTISGVKDTKVEKLARQFFEQVVQRDFPD